MRRNTLPGFAVAAVLVLPSLGLLYTLSQRDLLEAEH